jgi:hypothetical protein
MAQAHQVALEAQLELSLGRRIALVPAAVVIGLKELFSGEHDDLLTARTRLPFVLLLRFWLPLLKFWFQALLASFSVEDQ